MNGRARESYSIISALLSHVFLPMCVLRLLKSGADTNDLHICGTFDGMAGRLQQVGDGEQQKFSPIVQLGKGDR